MKRLKPRYTLVRLAYIFIDAVCIYTAIFLACWIREGNVGFDVTYLAILFNPDTPFQTLFLLWIVINIYCANSRRLYETRREVFEAIEIWTVAKSVCMASLAVIVGTYMLKIHGFPRSVLVIGAAFMIVFMSLWRVLKRFFVQYLVRRGYSNFNVLIIGAGKVGTSLAYEIHRRPALGMRVAGFLDDFKEGPQGHTQTPVLGKITDFEEIVQREFINKVFITVHHDNVVFLKILEHAKNLGVAVRVVPHGFDLISGELERYNIGFIPVLEYSDFHNFRRQAGKRLFDVVVSMILMVVLFPVFVVIAILIKLDSPGPVIYCSRRYSRRGRMFSMYKFRSMVVDADKVIDEVIAQNEVDGPIFKMRNDPRVTPFGRVLRKFSLDELPQVLNVLKGEMSLVGPRPLPIEQIEREDLRQFKRLEVRPGITGLWQIRGRSDISFSRLIKWDIWYINNWSFWLDWNILLQTVPVVFKGKGAY